MYRRRKRRTLFNRLTSMLTRRLVFRIVRRLIFFGVFTVMLSFSAFADFKFNSSDVPVTLSQKQAVRNEYEKLPDAVKNLFDKKGNSIMFFDWTTEEKDMLGAYAGIEGKGCIFLTNDGYDGAATLFHEVGHLIDDYAYEDVNANEAELMYRGFRLKYSTGGMTSRSELDDFKKIWLDEVDSNNSITKYESDSASEYFAGSFAAYIRDPEKLKKEAPKTYRFIRNIVEEL